MNTRVEREGIEDCIRKINDAVEQLNAAAGAIHGSMEELPNYWEGAAYEKARSVYEEEYRQLLTNTVPSAVESFRDYIDKCMEKIIELDQQLAGN